MSKSESGSKSKGDQKTGRAPQRARGKQRVAALLEAGSAVFADKGFEAATMTEVAARAGAPIGSLYQFFPNKGVLADALMQQYAERLLEGLKALEVQAGSMTASALADALLDILIDLREERAAALSLMNSRGDERKSMGLKSAMRSALAGLFRKSLPSLKPAAAEAIACVMQHLMKLAATLSVEEGARSSAVAELRVAARHYLELRLEKV